MKHKSLSSSAMLLDMNISVYTGRKQDKVTAEEVNLAKNTRSSKAASVYKSLFVGDADLEAINSHAGKVRTWLYSVTLPWSDSGTRLVPTKAFFDISHELSEHEKEFDRLVQQFVTNYGVKISSQAFKLGKLFNPVEYANGVFILVDESDQSLGYEFKNFNEAFRFAKTMGYEFSDNDYFV